MSTYLYLTNKQKKTFRFSTQCSGKQVHKFNKDLNFFLINAQTTSKKYITLLQGFSLNYIGFHIQRYLFQFVIQLSIQKETKYIERMIKNKKHVQAIINVTQTIQYIYLGELRHIRTSFWYNKNQATTRYNKRRIAGRGVTYK